MKWHEPVSGTLGFANTLKCHELVVFTGKYVDFMRFLKVKNSSFTGFCLTRTVKERDHKFVKKIYNMVCHYFCSLLALCQDCLVVVDGAWHRGSKHMHPWPTCMYCSTFFFFLHLSLFGKKYEYIIYKACIYHHRPQNWARMCRNLYTFSRVHHILLARILVDHLDHFL